MQLPDLVSRVGRAPYEAARSAAWELAGQTGAGDVEAFQTWLTQHGAVVRDLVDFIAAETSGSDEARTVFLLYRDMPSYSLLSSWRSESRGFNHYGNPEWRSTEFDDAFWDGIRNVLSEPDERLAAPMLYWLDVDWFWLADERATEAWSRLTDPALLEGIGLARVVTISRYVAWEAKEPVFRRLIRSADNRYLDAVFQGIIWAWASAYLYPMQLDADRAVEWLEKLHLSEEEQRQLDEVKRAVEDQLASHERQHGIPADWVSTPPSSAELLRRTRR